MVVAELPKESGAEAAAHTGNDWPTSICQIVRDDYTFNPHIKEDIAKWGGDFFSTGLDYNIVSILGPQSGGKSTLLNLLFGTDFQVMGMEVRRQTTKGLWLAHDASKNVLVMDVEGTDSKERGERHINFERKSALFSLALSEVLIINMWATDVGRYTASNYGTLKIVFELHLKLFFKEGSPKMLLLFILRDHSEKRSTSLDSLSRTLTKDMHDIWDEIQKPEVLKGRTIDEFFDFQFLSLANLIHEEDKFTSQVNELGRRFQDRQRTDAIFKPKYCKRIPADGLPEYASRIWETILSERDLDLPSVQEMLAQVRCEEIAVAQLAVLKKALDPLKNRLERGSTIEDFGQKLKDETVACLAKYDEMGHLYIESIYQARRKLLVDQVKETTEPLKQLMARNVMDKLARELEGDVMSSLSKIMALGSPNMWLQIGQVYLDTLEGIETRLKALATEVDAAPEQGEAWLQQGKQAGVDLVKRKARDETSESAMRLKLVERFKEHFLYYVEDGVRLPKDFTPTMDLQHEYKEAMKETMPLVELYARFEFPSVAEEPGEVLVLITDAEVSMHKKRLEEYVAEVYRQAKLDQKGHVSLASLPLWVFGIIVVLGFNETMWFARFMMNPANLLLVFMALIMAASVYVLHRVGALGAAEAVFMALAKEVLNQLNQGLGSFLAGVNQQQGTDSQTATNSKKDN